MSIHSVVRARIVAVAATSVLLAAACTGGSSPSASSAASIVGSTAEAPSGSPPGSIVGSTAEAPSGSPGSSAPLASGMASGGGYGGSGASPVPAASSSAAAGAYTLATASGTVGTYLTGEDGKTLYTFRRDPENTRTSMCTGTCAQNWPPFTLDTGETVTAGSGVTGRIAFIVRSDDNKRQVTYKGQPLYYYKGDAKAGDTNGQGIGGLWYVAAP